MHNSSQPKNWRDTLPIHPAADLFPPIPEAELKELAADIEAHGLQTPVVLWNPSEDPDDEDRYLLLDGRSRLDALALLGLLYVDQHGEIHLNKSWNGTTWLAYGIQLLARHREGGDPYALALSLNLHRRHLTTEQKRDLIAKLLKGKPEKSNREIARQTKADDKTVGKVRTELEATAEIPQLEKTVGGDGKSRSKPKKPAKPASTPKTDLIGSPPVRHSEVPATSIPHLSATVHFLVNNISRQLKEADGKLSTHDRAALFAKIRALVDADDIVGETLRLIEKMTPAQRRDFVARLQEGGLVDAFVLQGSAEISTEQRSAEHAARDGAGAS
jgi:hypothetical protein